MELKFVTGNAGKFSMAQHICEQVGIKLIQMTLDIDEIQGEEPEPIVKDKLAKAFAAAKQPVVVSDDSWSIPGLRGFPGAYMKSMNHWFTPENFLDLTKNLEDRSIFIRQFLAYTDGKETQIFNTDIPGEILTEARGKCGDPIQKVISIVGDNGKSVSEVYDAGMQHDPARLNNREDVWTSFAEWYSSRD